MNYIEVKNPEDVDEVNGHVLFFPWRERDEGDIQPDSVVQSMNRVTVVYVPADGESTRAVFEYTGTGGDSGLIGRRLEGPDPSDCTGVFRFGNKVGWYNDIEGSVRAMIVEYTLLQRRVNRFSDPHVLLPQQSLNAQVTTRDGKKAAVADSPNLLKEIMDGKGQVWLLAGVQDGNNFGYLQGEAMIESSIQLLEWLGNWIHISSGVAPTTFGVGIGKGESGEARKMAMQRSSQLCSEVRNGIERIMPYVLLGMGCPLNPDNPSEDVEVVWLDDPFADRGEAYPLVEAVYDRDEATGNELRHAAGMSPLTEEQQAQMQEKMEAEMTRTKELMEADPDNDPNNEQENEDGED